MKVSGEMTVKYMSDIQQLHKALQKTDKDYLLHGSLPANRIELTFEGTFNQQPVVWNASISTMAEYARHHVVAEDPKQFIDIRQVNDTYCIDICLNINQLDKAAVERTIIMVRKYKRLRLGKHEYGARSKTH